MTPTEKIAAGLAAVPELRAHINGSPEWEPLPLLCDALEAAQQRIAELEAAIREDLTAEGHIEGCGWFDKYNSDQGWIGKCDCAARVLPQGAARKE